MEEHRWTWMDIGGPGCACTDIDVHGSTWIDIDGHRSYMDGHRSTWMDILGHGWTLMDTDAPCLLYTSDAADE